MILPQLIVNGLIAGSLYALVASGFSLIYATNRFVHFAHGTVVTIGAYGVYLCFRLLHWPFILSAMAAIGIASFTGWLVYGIVYGPLKRRGASSAILLMASLAVMIFLENVPLLFFGPAVHSLEWLPPQESIQLGSAAATPLQIVIILVSLLLSACLWLFFRRTRYGATIRAVADNPQLAQVMGIPVARIEQWGMIIGSALAGVAGVLIALEQHVSPLMGTTYMIRGFTAAVIGGTHSLPGAVLGGYLLGVIENTGIAVLPSAYKDAIAFVILLIFLVIRPQGIFGIAKGTRE